MSAIRSDDLDGLVFTSDDGEEEPLFVDTTAFFGNEYPYANILEPGPNISKTSLGPLVVALRCLVIEAGIGLLVLGWLIWNSRH